MALTSKMAKSLAKEVKKPSMSADMVTKSKKELEDIIDKKSEDTALGMAARNELSRRQERKEFKKGNPTWQGETLKDTEAPEFKKGGMVKKVLAKKPAVKKPAVKKPVKKGK